MAHRLIQAKKRPKRWIQKALKGHKRGTLHRMLKISVKKKIPTKRLRRAIRVSKKRMKGPASQRIAGRTRAWWRRLNKRAQMAMNMRGGR